MNDIPYSQDQLTVTPNSIGSYPTTVDVVDLYNSIPETRFGYVGLGTAVEVAYQVLQRTTRSGQVFLHCSVALAGATGTLVRPQPRLGYPVVTVVVTAASALAVGVHYSLHVKQYGSTMTTVDHAIGVRFASGDNVELRAEAPHVTAGSILQFYLRYEHAVDREALGRRTTTVKLGQMPRWAPGLLGRQSLACHDFTLYDTVHRQMLCQVVAHPNRMSRVVCVVTEPVYIVIGRYSFHMDMLHQNFTFDIMVSSRKALTVIIRRTGEGKSAERLGVAMRSFTLDSPAYCESVPSWPVMQSSVRRALGISDVLGHTE